MLQSNMLREESAALRDQCAEYQSQGSALQNEAAEHVRTIGAAHAQLKLLQSRVRCCFAALLRLLSLHTVVILDFSSLVYYQASH